jgi:hypothetical protein
VRRQAIHATEHFLTRVFSRIRLEHPASEAEDVISRGRILGGLEPSRAFGDARYKWPREVQEMYAPGYTILFFPESLTFGPMQII